MTILSLWRGFRNQNPSCSIRRKTQELCGYFSAKRCCLPVGVAAGYVSFRLLATRKNPSQIFLRFSPDGTLASLLKRNNHYFIPPRAARKMGFLRDLSLKRGFQRGGAPLAGFQGAEPLGVPQCPCDLSKGGNRECLAQKARFPISRRNNGMIGNGRRETAWKRLRN